MIRILFFIISCLLIMQYQVYALDIVYPSKNETTINAQSTFFIGNVNKRSTLKINNDGVKIWDKGAFVQVVPLFYGLNKFTIEETYSNGKKKTIVYKIRRERPSVGKSIDIPYEPKQEGEILYTKTTNNNSTIRNKPSSSSKRITELPKGVVLYVEGKKGNYYKIDAKGDSEFWIHKSNIELL